MGVSRLSAKPPWTAVWTPGFNLVNFFNLYDSKGNVEINAPTSIATTLDGPIQVARYGALAVNAALSVSQRCRGLILLSDWLSVGTAGSVSMTARGAAGAKNWAVDKDIFVPQSITFTGKNTSYAEFLKWIRITGYCIFDPSMYACPPPGMGDVQCDWATWTPFGSTIISAAGCGAGKVTQMITIAGPSGSAGTNAPGGGGCGSIALTAVGNIYGGKSGAGRPWGGGPGSSGVYSDPQSYCTDADQFGGRGGDSKGNGGGGAGNPGGLGANGGAGGGEGTGGVLFVVSRGAVSLTTNHVLSANGSKGGDYAAGCGGGASGGGFVGLYYSGALTGTPNLTANGGVASVGNTSYGGGAGGAGSTKAQTFTQMGWV